MLSKIFIDSTSTAFKVKQHYVIPVPNKVTKRSTQLYSVSTAVLWSYDYLLTVGDEVGIY